MAKYSYSTDEETYVGEFDSVQQARDEAAGEVGVGHHFWVGENSRPTQPEDYWDAGDWLDMVGEQDDYAGDYADGWDNSTKSQRDELNKAVREVMAAWLDRHKLRPRFWLVVKPQKFYVAGKREAVWEIEAL